MYGTPRLPSNSSPPVTGEEAFASLPSPLPHHCVTLVGVGSTWVGGWLAVGGVAWVVVVGVSEG
eukprot:1576613-Prorocentrum_lima.AAC.1